MDGGVGDPVAAAYDRAAERWDATRGAAAPALRRLLDALLAALLDDAGFVVRHAEVDDPRSRGHLAVLAVARAEDG